MIDSIARATLAGCTMPSKKAKRKIAVPEDPEPLGVIDVPAVSEAPRSKKQKGSTVVEDEVIEKKVKAKPKGKHPKKKTSTMSQEMADEDAEYVAVYQSDTPEEAQKERKEARHYLGVTHIRSDATIGEMLARRKQENEARVIRTSKSRLRRET